MPAVLHAHWAGPQAVWSTGPEPARRAWRGPAVITLTPTIGAWHLEYYRIKNRLSLTEMVERLDSCVSARDLQRIELGQQPITDELQAWLAGPR